MEVFRRATEDRAIGLKRRWRLPPPLIQEGDGPGPVGLAVLEEFPSEFGAVLWKSLRSTLLWAEQDVDSRRGLFEKGSADRRQLEILAAVPEDATEIREALENLLAILERPERTDREFVSVACTRIATWAEGRDAPRTALEYLQGAAICAPADPVPALAAGRIARDLAKYGRAEAWIHRAIGLARQAKNWPAYVEGYIAHGKMMFQRGVLPAARRSFLKAVRRSRRQSFQDGEARALHALFILEHRSGRPVEALAYAEDAVRVHGPAHPALPYLAHDIAYHWLESGDARYALPVFLETLNRAKPRARPAVLGSIARAAGGTGDVNTYEWARGELRRVPPIPGVAEGWVDAARGALELERYTEAEEAARMAESIARERREGQMRFLAEAIMEDIQRERERPDPSFDAERILPKTSQSRLARELIRSLQHAPPTGYAGADA